MSHLGIENLEIMLEYVFSLFCRNHAPRPWGVIYAIRPDLRMAANHTMLSVNGTSRRLANWA